MDQYAMGINSQVPARTVQPKRAELNDYVGRLSYMLQGGRHVADVAVLYPIDSLHADYHNAGGRAVPLVPGEKAAQCIGDGLRARGRRAPGRGLPGRIGEDLFRASRVDYTYLHPEVLVENCTVDHGRLILNNKENREEYKVLIVPAGDTSRSPRPAKIEEFYDQGGTIIATGQLPTHSSEFGKDHEVQQAIADVFGVAPGEPLKADLKRAQDRQNYLCLLVLRQEEHGGRTGLSILPNTHPWLIDTILKMALPSGCRYSAAFGRFARAGV